MHEFDSTSEGRLRDLADRMPVTGNSAEYLLPYYGIDSRYDVEGQKTLDICAGGSSLTAALLSYGADAYALDLGYKNARAFKDKIRFGSQHRVSNNDSASHLAQFEGANNSHLVMSDRGALNMNFVDSIDGYPERYVGECATSIPFPDESFDQIYSFYGVFGVLDEEEDLLQVAIGEAIRVLKKGGILQLGPLLDIENIPERVKENQLRVIEGLKKKEDLIVLDGDSLCPTEKRSGFLQFRKLVVKKKTESLIPSV